jgi:multidrug efflux system membrane fusion protein
MRSNMKPINRKKAVLTAAAALALVLAAVLLWPSGGPAKKGGGRGGDDRPVPVETALVVLKDMPIWLDAIGTVQAYNTVTVRPRVDGELVEVAFREGQDVKAGDLLARIDSRTYQAQYQQALATRDKDAAQLEAARRDLARYESLGNRVTGQSVDTQRALVKQLEASVRADQAAVDNARTMLDYTTIAAPIDGRTGMRLVDKGNLVRASDTSGLVVLTQVQPISVVFTLPQQDLAAVMRETAAQGPLTVVAVEADRKTVLDTGRLELVDNQIDTTTGTIKLKAVMPNPERKLWPGAFVNLRLLLSVRKDGLVVPAAAVQRGPNGTYVFAAKADDTVEMRPVTVAVTENDQALLAGGVEAGETVVTEGTGKLKEGSRIAAAGKGGAPAEKGKGKGKRP